MEYNFKKVHTAKDLAISTIVLMAGIGLFFINKGLGICIGICGLSMYLVYKDGYKKDGGDILLTRKSEDISKACRTSIIEFLEGKNTEPEITQGNEGGSIRLDLYFNRSENVAYAQLYDFCNYNYEPATGVVELKGDRADKLISLI
ncbi:MAG: hypothetical protein MJY50_00950 [Bacteroidales bacterium]|nr:hypothetical protein [Bacteroidales bacterium]